MKKSNQTTSPVIEMTGDKCCLCGAPLSNPYNNNNAEPLVYEGNGIHARCCSDCDNQKVIPFRMLTPFVKDEIIRDCARIAMRYSLVQDTNAMKLAHLVDARAKAQRILNDSPFIGEDYYKMEDFITEVIAGKSVTAPTVRCPEWYGMYEKVQDYFRQATTQLVVDSDEVEWNCEDFESVTNDAMNLKSNDDDSVWELVCDYVREHTSTESTDGRYDEPDFPGEERTMVVADDNCLSVVNEDDLIYVLVNEWRRDTCAYGVETYVYTDHDEAMKALAQAISDARCDMSDLTNVTEDDYCEGDMSFSIYEDGYEVINHIHITLEQKILK